jgi:hypothetical protein
MRLNMFSILAGVIAASAVLSLFVCVARAMLTHRIGFKGLLSDSFDGKLSGGRVQAMVVSVGVIITYAALAIQQLSRGDVATLPDPQDWMIAALGSSFLGYLSIKAVSAKIATTLFSAPESKGDTRDAR